MVAPLVLALLFLDEVLAFAALAYAGVRLGGSWGWLLGPVVALGVAVLWARFASPKASHGGPAARPVVKVLAFGAAVAGLWAADHPGLAVALLVFSVVVNALAQLPVVRATVADLGA